MIHCKVWPSTFSYRSQSSAGSLVEDSDQLLDRSVPISKSAEFHGFSENDSWLSMNSTNKMS